MYVTDFRNTREFKFFNDESDEVSELIRLIKPQVSHSTLVDLWGELINLAYHDRDFELQVNKEIILKGNSSIEFEGSFEYSSQESSVYLDIYSNKTGEHLCEMNYSIGDCHAGESQLLSFEAWKDNTKEEENMANLSERVNPLFNGDDNLRVSSNFITKNGLEELRESVGTTQQTTTLNNTGDTSMRTLNLTLLDQTSGLKAEQRVVYSKKEVLTEYSDEQTIQNILATGEVLATLKEHNEKRLKIRDKAFKGAATAVFLEEIEHLGDPALKWQIVQVG